jgi:iron complex outermembrane receptor protein
MYKIFLTFSIVISFSSALVAQKVTGFVKDLETQKAIPAVGIFADQALSKPITSTAENGSFQLDFSQLVIPTLWFSHPDYVVYTAQLIKQNNNSIQLYIELIPLTIEKEAITVSATRAQSKTPTTFINLNKKDIAAKNFGQDFPYILQSTPATVVFSDAGAGVGYTGIRIRGVDQTRINVTINGIPVNDGESQGVFWVDLPDISSSMSSVQIQRGVGTSTNGAAAFGASINVKTDNLPQKAFAQYQLGFGSFNTNRNTIQFGTGLLPNKWSFMGRMSFIKSDGFIDRASSDLKSWYVSTSKSTKNGLFKANVFNGHERTYQAWYGVPQPKFLENSAATENFISQLYMGDNEAALLRNSNSQTYNPYTYKNQVDDYSQTYYQLFYNHFFNKQWSLNTAAYYTKGNGFYEEYKNKQTLQNYGIAPIIIDSANTLSTSDLVRRRWLDNGLVGALYNLQYITPSLSVYFGGGLNTYKGQHFGQVIWARNAGKSETEHEYYRNKAQKTEFNQFVKGVYAIKRWSLYADAQIRGINYQFVGPDRNQNSTDRTSNYFFFNPKAGATYDLNNHSHLYLSAAIANKEPVRDDFINSSTLSVPKPERLTNIEGGYRIKKERLVFTVNGYLMHYKDQLVLTGKINDVGAYTRTNIDKSYRVGLETDASITILKWLQWSGNLALSSNKIRQFTEFVDDWDNGTQLEITHKKTTLAFSPAAVAASQFRFIPLAKTDLSIDLINKYVGQQYLDNTQSELRVLDAFWLQDVVINYDINTKKTNKQIKGLKISGLVNNVFNLAYAPNGYTFSGFSGGQRNDFNYVYPQAGINFMLRLVADF